MTKTNTAVRLRPRKGTPHGQEDSAVDEDEDEVRAGSEDERTANLLNSRVSSGKKKDATTNSLFTGLGRIGGLLGIRGKTVIEETQQPTEDADGDNVGQDLGITSTGDEEEEDARELVSPGPIPQLDPEHVSLVPSTLSSGPPLIRTNLAKRKRPGRRDIYEIQTTPERTSQDDEDEDEAEQPARKHIKFSVKSPKAKKPLDLPKGSQAKATTNRETRGNNASSSKNPEPSADTDRGSRVEVVIAEKSGKPKRGRGRPPMNRPKPAAVIFNSDTVPHRDLLARDTEESDVVEYARADSEDGVDDILLDPSPIKPLVPKATRYEAFNSISESSKATSLNSNIEASDSEDEDKAGEVEAAADERNAEKRGNRQREALPEPSDELINFDDLENMFVIARHVGHKHVIVDDEWVFKHKEKLRSVPGKRMDRRLRALTEGYDALRDAKSNGEGYATDTCQISVTKIVTLVKDEARNVFERLENPELDIPDSDQRRISTMLTDVYYNLIPSFTKALKAGVEAHQDDGTMTTEALEEIDSLLNLIRELGERALKQSKTHQPTARNGNLYQVKQPTKQILPIVQKLCAALKKELSRRERVRKTEAWNRGAAQREKIQQEKEERELAERRRKNREICRLQKKALVRKLKDPLWGLYLKSEIEREEAKAEKRGTKRRGVTTNGHNALGRSVSKTPSWAVSEPDDGDFESDPFDDEPERVSVFGDNNNSTVRGPMPLSKEEKEVFIDTMRHESKTNRYEIAAERLGRSMDEIFAFAKELQEAMDDAHEKGRLSKDYDEWTYDIWIEQR